MSAEQEMEEIKICLQQLEKDEDKRNITCERRQAEREKEDTDTKSKREDEDSLIKTAAKSIWRRRQEQDIRRQAEREKEDKHGTATMPADGGTNDVIGTSICTENGTATTPSSVVKLVERHLIRRLSRRDKA